MKRYLVAILNLLIAFVLVEIMSKILNIHLGRQEIILYVVIISMILTVIEFIISSINDNKIKKYKKVIKKGDIAELGALIAENPKIIEIKNMNGETLLHFAAEKGQAKIVELLLDNGAKVDARAGGDRISDGYTPLDLAVEKGYKEISEILLNRGASVMGGNEDLLFKAIEAGNKEIVELLISKGADINAKDVWDSTPLDCAKKNHNQDIIELLQEHGAKE